MAHWGLSRRKQTTNQNFGLRVDVSEGILVFVTPPSYKYWRITKKTTYYN